MVAITPSLVGAALLLLANTPRTDWLIALIGLSPRTNYSLTVAAATRAGIGPKSPPLHFTTTLKSTQIDNEAPSRHHSGEGFDASNYFVDPGVATLPPLKVHNLRYVARERNILLLWSIPPISVSPHRIRGVVVRWGNIYPGPNKAEVSLEKRAFSIEPLATKILTGHHLTDTVDSHGCIVG